MKRYAEIRRVLTNSIALDAGRIEKREIIFPSGEEGDTIEYKGQMWEVWSVFFSDGTKRIY